MALTPLHLQDFCLAGDEQCRYLCMETVDGKSVSYCTKHAPEYYRQLRREMQHYDINLDKRGDNCPGYLLLKYKMQGYDVD